MGHQLLTVASLALIVAGCAGGPKNRHVAPDGASPLGPAPVALDQASPAPSEGTADSASESTPGANVTAEIPPVGDVVEPDVTESDVVVSSDLGDDRGATPARGQTPTAAKEPSGTGNVRWPQTRDDNGAVTIATVGGRPIDLRELVTKWLQRDPGGVRGVLDDLVLSQITVFEAAALRIELPDGAVEERVKRSITALSKQAKASGVPDLDAYVRGALGLEPEVFVEQLKRDAAVDLLTSRCVRAWMLSSDHRVIRAIAVKDEAGSREVQARLARGEPFADVAKALSMDRSSEDGGLMPPVVRGDQPIARTAFATDVGGVVGPIKDGEGFVFVSVEAAPTPLEGGWEEIGGAVEASIEERGVEDMEAWQWIDAMYTRYEIDITPFLDLAGR